MEEPAGGTSTNREGKRSRGRCCDPPNTPRIRSPQRGFPVPNFICRTSKRFPRKSPASRSVAKKQRLTFAANPLRRWGQFLFPSPLVFGKPVLMRRSEEGPEAKGVCGTQFPFPPPPQRRMNLQLLPQIQATQRSGVQMERHTWLVAGALGYRCTVGYEIGGPT